MPSVPYRAPRWLPGGNLQTLYAALLADAGEVPRYRRVRWDTPDGDFVDVDWCDAHVFEPDRPVEAPLAVLFHGLEGSSRSHYARVLAHAFARAGWQVAVVHFRGCSGEPNRLARAYHSGDSAEISWMLARFAEEARARPVAVGISLGGNALLKYLGEAGPAAGRVLAAAVSVSAPMDLMLAGDALGRGFARIYSAMFLRTLKKKSEEKARRYRDQYDLAALRRARSLRAFNDAVTAPLHGFRDTDDYWTRSSAKPLLRSIAVPTLLLNARNDPFLPQAGLPGRNEVAPCVEFDFPRQGGHVGFVGGRFPGNFDRFTQRIIGFVGVHADAAMSSARQR